MKNTIMIENVKVWTDSLIKQHNSIKPEGGAIVVFETINGIEYIHHNPYEFTFVQPEEIEIINGKQFVKSAYLLPILERKYELLFKIPSNNR